MGRWLWIGVVGALAAGAPAAAQPGPGYQIALPERLEIEAGQGEAVSLTIAPASGHVISRTGPLRVSLAATPAEGLDLPRHRYKRAQAADRLADAPRFDLAVRGVRPGRYQLALDILFWLCRGRVCRPIRAERAVEVQVRAAPAPS